MRMDWCCRTILNAAHNCAASLMSGGNGRSLIRNYASFIFESFPGPTRASAPGTFPVAREDTMLCQVVACLRQPTFFQHAAMLRHLRSEPLLTHWQDRGRALNALTQKCNELLRLATAQHTGDNLEHGDAAVTGAENNPATQTVQVAIQCNHCTD